jgi:1-acyl-sn-glycerol-3-phosphate acyltransferase
MTAQRIMVGRPPVDFRPRARRRRPVGSPRVRFLDDPDVAARVARLELPFNRHGVDPYGVSRTDLTRWLSLLAFFYRRYFDVSVHGIDHVPPRGRALLIGNHSGGIALDAAMVIVSCLMEMEPPRLAQGMVEKFMATVPFLSSWTARCGQFTGLPEHAERLLREERLLMVFPEGARGTAKLFWERHSLVDFGTGFMRLALATDTPIVPFAFVGGGEAIPTVKNLYALGRLVGAPYVPVTPWLVPLPRPTALAVHYGAPMRFYGTGREDDHVIANYVGQVKQRVAELLADGVTQRRAGRRLLPGRTA